MSTMTTPRPPDTAERTTAPRTASPLATPRVDELTPAPPRRSLRERVTARVRRILPTRRPARLDGAEHMRRLRAHEDAQREREASLTLMHTSASLFMR